MRPSPRPTSAMRWGRGARVAQEGEKGSRARGWLSPRVFAQRAYPILTVEPRVVSRLSAPHPLAGGLAASLPERGALGGATRLPTPALSSGPKLRAPRPAPAPPAPLSACGCRELTACHSRCRSSRPPRPKFAARRSSRGGGGRGQGGEKEGSGGGTGREGRPLASPPSFLCTLR